MHNTHDGYEKFEEISALVKKTNFEIIESGNSFPEEIDFENSVSTGLTLVKTFAEQLKGEIRLQKKPTTNYFISLDLS